MALRIILITAALLHLASGNAVRSVIVEHFESSEFSRQNGSETGEERSENIVLPKPKPYFYRCCHFTKYKCSENENIDLTVPVYNLNTAINVSEHHFEIKTDKVCNIIFPLDPIENQKWFIQSDGSLFHPEKLEMIDYSSPDEYCVHFKTEGNVTTGIEVQHCLTSELSASSVQNMKEIQAHPILDICMLISMPFLLVTLLVYACVPDLQNIHGRCLICYVASLLVAYLFLVSVQLDTSQTDSDFCLIAPFIIYFAFMASFMWLHVMCLDIWWTFSGLRGYKGSAKKSEQKRFLLYSLYAWGVPVLMLSITLGLQFAKDLPDWVITPQIAVTKCWFPDDKTLGVYFYGPILLIIVVNLFLFAYTTYKIWSVQKTTDQSMKNESQRHGTDSDKQRFKLYLKLMFVFGVNWLMEIISWLAHGPQWLWYVTDMCNALYGVFIFFIFVCKANVWKLVRKRYDEVLTAQQPDRKSSYPPTGATT